MSDDPNAHTANTFCPNCRSKDVEWIEARIYRCRECQFEFDLRREQVNT